MKIDNIQIREVNPHYYQVIGDTKLYGKAEILAECTTQKAAEAWAQNNSKVIDYKNWSKVTEPPLYVRDLIRNFRYSHSPNAVKDFTILVCKPTPLMTVRVFRQIVDRFVRWAKRSTGCMDVVRIEKFPERTHKCWQYAEITVFDPVMKMIEIYRTI